MKEKFKLRCSPSHDQGHSFANNFRALPEHQKIIAVIPCFNTENTIKNIILTTKKYVDEVAVIDDGSFDRTPIIAKSLGAYITRHSENGGYGKAIKSCFTTALANGADIIITIDGDGQHDPNDIPHLLDPLLNGQADVVIGSRFLGSNDIPRYRRLGISVINYLWNFGAKLKLSDSQSGFRVYRKNIVQSLNLLENGMSISIEIIEQIRRSGAIIKEIPITCSYYNNSSLSIHAIFHGLRVAISVVRIRLNGRFPGVN
jgi:glycosyltransferase involved in cell wall biosynthesis